MSIPVAKKYIKNFENLGFGMFIHFGLYSLIGQGEWVGKLCADDPKLPVGEAEYKKLMNAFNPGSMEEIVALKNVKWMDNGEELECSYKNGNLKINITGYPYSVDYCVRVACADFE